MGKTTTVAAINERLTAAGTGVKLEQRGNRLSLRATLPSKDGISERVMSESISPKISRRKQQRISLNLIASSSTLKYAEAKAMALSVSLAMGTFKWIDWIQEPSISSENLTAGDWVEKYRIELEHQGKFKDPDDWKQYYFSVFKKLDLDKKLNSENIMAAVLSAAPNTRQRSQNCYRLGQLAIFAGIEVDLKPYRGDYSSHSKKITRNIPTDIEIVQIRDSIVTGNRRLKATSCWQYVFSLLAVYGLRAHEAFFCEIESEPPYRCFVREGKTGARTVLPLYPEWAEAWRVWEKNLPVVKLGDTHRRLGEATVKAFIYYKLPVKAHSLRHAWCLRGSVKFRIPIRIMAQMAGHSPAQHLNTYSRYLNASEAEEVYFAITGKNDAPKAP